MVFFPWWFGGLIGWFGGLIGWFGGAFAPMIISRSF
jgi:hypothetical protein